MDNTAWDLEIKMLVPFDTMIFYPDDYKDDYVIEPSFKKIMDLLKIDIDIPAIVEDLYRYRGKNSAISIYYSNNSYGDFILLDTDIEPSDQLDLIVLCIRCSGVYGGIIRQYAHEFYTKRCKYNVIYSEGNFVIRDTYKTDFTLFSQISSFGYKHAIKNRKICFYQSGNLLKNIITK